MSNQSSVQWLFKQLWDTPKDKFEWQAIFLKANQMHKEEMFEYIKEKYCIGPNTLQFHSLEFEQYYNEAFAGNNERKV